MLEEDQVVGSGWIRAQDQLPDEDALGRASVVLAWGSLFNGTKLGPPAFLLASVAVHPKTGPFWRAHGWPCEVTWWRPLPPPPSGEHVEPQREPDTGAC